MFRQATMRAAAQPMTARLSANSSRLVLRSLTTATATRSFTAANIASPTPLLSLVARKQFPIARIHSSATQNAEKEEASITDKAKGALQQVNKDLQHTTASAREELQGVTRSFAELIAGGSPSAAALGARERPHHQGGVAEDFMAVTKGLFKEVPRPAMLFGLAGLVPYVGTALGTVALAREAGRVAAGERTLSGLDLQSTLDLLHTVEHIQITYGAVILSFLGAIHWGFEFAKYGGEVGYQRLAFGIIPLLAAWPTTFLSHGLALIAQWTAFTGAWVIDQRAGTQGWTPNWYSTYRFYLSIAVGFSIIGTLAGTSYYGAGSGSMSAAPGTRDVTTAKVSSMKRLEKVSAKNNSNVSGRLAGDVDGDIVAEDLAAADSGEGYVRIQKHEEAEVDEEAEAENERIKQEKLHKQDTKEIDQAATSPAGFKTELKSRTDQMHDGTKDKKASAGRADDGEGQ